MFIKTKGLIVGMVVLLAVGLPAPPAQASELVKLGKLLVTGKRAPSTDAKPAADTPSPSPTPARQAKNSDVGTVHQVTLAINDWLRAWENRDMGAYLASYTDDFVGQNEASHTTWVKSRTARITGASSISVDYSKLKVILERGNTTKATFLQSYRSDSYQDRTQKTLMLKKVDGKWLISQELT